MANQSDIDFDELDKAVNSLMGGVHEPEDDTPKAKTLEVKDTLQPGEDPMYDKLGEVARGIGNETLEGVREKTVVEDFVPDSDDDANVPLPKLPVEELSQDDTKSSDDTEKTDDTSVRPPAARRPTNGSRFMDVVHPSLDMKSTTPSTMPMPSRPISAVSTPVEPSRESNDDVKNDDDVPLTPFLPDANAKVEKRPLGGLEPEPADEQPEDPVEDPTADGKEQVDDVQQPATPDAVAPELTEDERELQTIESKMVDESLLEDPAAMQQVESGDTGSIHNDEKERDHQHKGHHDKKDDQSAIFDVEHYHKPLKATPPKKMGPLKLTGIVLLVIILSAGVGAGAVYLLFSMGLYAP